MAEKSITRVLSKPGVKRDGTMLEGDAYVDAQWCRFQRGLPRKIGGFRSINRYISALPRALHEYTENLLTYVHVGTASTLERFFIDGALSTSVISDRTPATLAPSANNLWQFDVASTNSLGALLLAQAAPNLRCICNSVGGQIFVGGLFDTTALTEVTLPVDASATGGIVMLWPYLMFFGSDGYVGWSVPGDPTDLSGVGSGATRITGQKIIKAMQVRGGAGASPSGLLWSADSLLRATFVGGAAVWSFDTISAQTSILSSSSVIEYDGVYYWLGTDRFLQFNGVVREVDNQMNLNYFFDNVNYSQRQKIFAFKIPRYGEIWWCYPHGDATECTHAIIYNVRENTWYDTALPADGRGAGAFPAVFRRPLMTSNTPDGGGYKLWVHETGVDKVDGTITEPIPSSFETAEVSLPVMAGADKALQVLVMEPDFIQSGDMTVSVRGRSNARAPEVDGEAKVFPAVASSPEEQIVMFKEQRRQLRFRFESNTVGGDYQMGHTLVHTAPSDGRLLG